MELGNAAERSSSAARHDVMSSSATRYESQNQHEKRHVHPRPLERLVRREPYLTQGRARVHTSN